jgi:hypothetical protein
MLVLFQNESNNNLNYTFPDSSFFDRDGDTIHSVTLSPWSATVLIYNNKTPPLGIEKPPVISSNINVFPNPANGYITLTGNSINEIGSQLKIYDINGQLKYISLNYKEGQNIDLASFPAGVYVVKLISEKNLSQAMFVKVK